VKKLFVVIILSLVLLIHLSGKSAMAADTCGTAGASCGGSNPPCCAAQGITCSYGVCIASIIPIPTGSTTSSICDYVPDTTQKEECNKCFTIDKGAWTAVGCIKTAPNNLLGSLLGLGTGIAGGIAFLLILFGGLQIMTSTGNPEQMNAGRELITSAITGLLLIIFAVFLLRFIGYNIIGIPGFGVAPTPVPH
jgi:hypothetical protein